MLHESNLFFPPQIKILMCFFTHIQNNKNTTAAT